MSLDLEDLALTTYIFECNRRTYLDCVEKNVFGSNIRRVTN